MSGILKLTFEGKFNIFRDDITTQLYGGSIKDAAAMSGVAVQTFYKDGADRIGGAVLNSVMHKNQILHGLINELDEIIKQKPGL